MMPRHNLPPVLLSKRDTYRNLQMTDEDIWKAQQEDSVIQTLYDAIMEKGELVENASTKFTVLEDKVQYTEWCTYLTKRYTRCIFHLHYANNYSTIIIMILCPAISEDIKRIKDYKPLCIGLQTSDPKTSRETSADCGTWTLGDVRS